MDLIKLHLKDADGNLVGTRYLNPTRVASIYAPEGSDKFFVRLDDGSAYSIPIESLDDVKGMVSENGGSSGGEGIDIERPTNLNETIDAVMNLASRDDEEGVDAEELSEP